MATQAIIVSYSIVDADGDRASMPIYGLFDDSTATLSSIVAWAAARAAQIDAILDGQIVAENLTIYPTLPGGLKTSPNAGSDVEKTALFTWGLGGIAASHSQGMDIPAFLPSKFVGDAVNTVDTAVAAFVTGILPPFGTVTPTNEDWSSGLYSLRKAVKSFRKLGRR